jgi:hypothetical protein
MEIFKRELNFFISNSDVELENEEEKEYFKKCMHLLIESLRKWTQNTPREFRKSAKIIEELNYIHDNLRVFLKTNEVIIKKKKEK